MTAQEKIEEIAPKNFARRAWKRPEIRTFEAGEAEAAAGVGADAGVYS